MGDPYARIGADPTGRTALDWGIYGVPETFVVGAGRDDSAALPRAARPGRDREAHPAGDGGGRVGDTGEPPDSFPKS